MIEIRYMAEQLYASIITEYPNATIPAINFYLVLKGVRPAYQYDYTGESINIIDKDPLKFALKLCKELIIFRDGNEPLVCLKSNKNIAKCNTMGEVLGYRYTCNDWVTSKPNNAWFVGYSIKSNTRFFTPDCIYKNFCKYILYGYTIPKDKYTKEIATALQIDTDTMNTALEALSFKVYPFHITLSEIYVGDGSVFGIPPL